MARFTIFLMSSHFDVKYSSCLLAPGCCGSRVFENPSLHCLAVSSCGFLSFFPFSHKRLCSWHRTVFSVTPSLCQSLEAGMLLNHVREQPAYLLDVPAGLWQVRIMQYNHIGQL